MREQGSIFASKDGTCERDHYRTMSNAKQTKCLTPASSETLLTMLETLPGALFVVDDTDTIVYANASVQMLTGASPEELVGNPFWRGAAHLVSTALYQAVRETRQTRALTEVEYVSPVTQSWLHVQLSPTVGGLMLQFQQGRAATRCQETFAQGERLSIDDLDGLHTRIGVLTPEGIVLEINEVPLEDAHLRREEVIGQPLAQTPWWSFSPAGQEQLRTAIARASTGEAVCFETLLRPREGVFRHFAGAITPRMDVDHHVEYLVIAGIDVTARKRAEDEIHALIDTIPQLVWIRRPDGYVEYTNQRWCDYTGLSTQQAKGDGWLQAIHPDDQQRILALWKSAVQTGRPYEAELRLLHGTTGAYRWFLIRSAPYKDAQGTILKYVGTCTYIDEQKRIEEALRQSQERASVLMNSNMIGINVIEEEQIVDANETFLRMTGYTREDLHAGRMNVMHMTAPEDLARTQQVHQELATQQSITYEKEYVCKDGSRLPVVVCGVVLKRHPFQGISFVLDNSARKELEQRKDTFISMASHELRTPLTILKLQTALLKRKLAKQGIQASAAALSKMEAQVNKATALVEELLDVSKIQAGRLEYRREPVDLDALLREITDTMQQTHPSHRILVHGAVQTSLIGDRDRLAQVFINLLSNAIKYSPDAETVEIHLDASPEMVTIRIHDHGLGIPQEQRKKIFERFYRAASPKQGVIPGLGMGLYIVTEIIKRHGGTITVESEVGKGSTFTVTLPKKMDD